MKHQELISEFLLSLHGRVRTFRFYNYDESQRFCGMKKKKYSPQKKKYFRCNQMTFMTKQFS